MDKLTPGQRSAVMAAVKNKNTTPEIKVRKALHAMGYRFRLNQKNLPGKPDIVLAKHRLCIFIHGCFWHQHPGCKRSTMPATNRVFWIEKFNKNKARDHVVETQLKTLGWRMTVVWECETKNPQTVAAAIKRCFSGTLATATI